jgi:hypothetical protein
MSRLGATLYGVYLPGEGKDPQKARDTITFECTYIALKLPDKPRSQQFSELVFQLQRRAVDRDQQFPKMYEEYTKLCRSILGDAWSDVLTDLELNNSPQQKEN